MGQRIGWMKKWKAMTSYEAVLAADCSVSGCRAVLNSDAPATVKKYAVRSAGESLLTVLLLAASVLKIFYSVEAASFTRAASAAEAEGVMPEMCSAEDFLPGYREYEAAFEAVYPDQEIVIDAEDCVRYAENGRTVPPVLYRDYQGMTGGSIYTGGDAAAEFAVRVEEAGFYELWLEYYPLAGSDSAIVRSIMIDGAVPYREMECVSYDRIWKQDAAAEDAPEEREVQNCRETGMQAAESRYGLTEKKEWTEGASYDRTRRIEEPLSVYLEKGDHTVSLLSLEEPMLLHQIILKQKKPVPGYRQVKRFWDAVGIRAAEGEPTVIEAERIAGSSSRTVGLVQEVRAMSMLPARMSAYGETAGSRAVGGSSWKETGAWIEWEFDVEAAGYYHISLLDCQNYVRGADAYRKIMLDGTVPFAEMACYGFSYGWGWKEDVLSDDAGTPYVFYLKQGRHTLRMEAVPGKTDSGDFEAGITPLAIDRIQIVPAGP